MSALIRTQPNIDGELQSERGGGGLLQLHTEAPRMKSAWTSAFDKEAMGGHKAQENPLRQLTSQIIN